MARPRAKLDRGGEADLVSRRRRRTEPPGARRERLLAIQLGLVGELGLDRIAQAVGRSRATIQTWLNTYRQGGVDALRVITLPAYSPELNPIEGLWDQVKDGLCNRGFATLAELGVVLQVEWQRFWQDARRVHSLIFDWLLVQANTSSPTVLPDY